MNITLSARELKIVVQGLRQLQADAPLLTTSARRQAWVPGDAPTGLPMDAVPVGEIHDLCEKMEAACGGA